MSSNDQPPAKRKRAEDPREDSTLATPVVPGRSSLWYFDGNVVLQADGTQWKVYKGVLARSSSIFQDMFSLPQPPSMDAGTVDGCPVVQLSDSAEEVEYVLQAICQREYVSFEEELPLPVISAFIRLGTKYEILKLRLEGQKRIFKEFPADLNHAHTGIHGKWKFVTKPDHWLELVLFARTTGLLSILPFALYVCCQVYTTSEIMEGIKQSDGAIIYLSIQDQLACLAGFQAICKAQAETTFSWAYTKTRTAGCIGKSCAHYRQAVVNISFTSLPAIQGLNHFNKFSRQDGGLCSVCADQAEEMHTTGRKAFWTLLPGLFGLPPWEELCKEREEVE